MAGEARYGNDSLNFVCKESVFGTTPTFPGTFKAFRDTVVGKEASELYESKRKFGQLMEMDAKLVAREMGSVTVSGDLTSDHAYLLEAMTGVTSTPYAYAEATLGTLHSYTIIKRYSKATAKDEIFNGCILKDVEFKYDSGSPIQFTANFICLKPLFEQTLVAGTAPSASVYNTVTFFPSSTTQGHYSSYSMKFENMLPDNKLLYKNSKTLYTITNLLQGRTGNVTIENQIALGVYDNATQQTEMYARTIGSVVPTTIIMTSAGAVTWTFTLSGVLDSYDVPDPDNGLFIMTRNYHLVYNTSGGVVPVSVAVA